ncbi:MULTISPECIES: TRAP transporter large permease [Ramlibacter]|uniref:TRAP transporter large permease protein n=1 Tax=Ramlibacter pinisoli TaxID=2682844 RepID=A0A6N8INX4_9BURK|nr:MULTISPECIES: TRAP transporter large permease [Ramlibacter]MBA2963507.1 TRAP transporter large permease [Ramlibacter sp. CGMCC 1.13660]MVQ28474.1 TRAP transporter large permease subunit [Ramlibacter pinisoli]
MSLAVVLGFMALAMLGLPIAFSMGVAALGALWATGVDFSMVPTRMMHAVNSFPLMSIPFFMLAGELMIKAGIVERLIALANTMVGRVRGGLAHVTMLAGAGLATVSGAAVSDASALSSTLVPSLTKVYDRGFATAIVAAAANLGPIIPPSGAMIVYAFMAGSSVSVGGMFMAGVVPGLVITIGFIALCSWIAGRRGWAVTGEPFRLAAVVAELKRSLIVLAMPVVVIGGIVGGAFTATEGSAIAVIYAALLGFFVTRTLRVADLPGIAVRAAITTAMVGALIAFASVITYLMTVDLLPQKLSVLLRGFTDSPLAYMALVAVLLFVVGMFLESNAAYIMLVPLLHPIAIQYGIDPLHFGFLFVLNLVIGMLTPPVGVVLFVVCGITGVRMRELVANLWPFIVLMYGVLVACMLFPPLVTALPRALGY